MNILKKKIDEKDYNNEFSHKLIAAEKHFYKIHELCNGFWKGCGSYLFNGEKYEYFIGMYPKQKILYEKAKQARSVLEFGTYMGHSCLIMLVANPNLNITCIDIDDKYSKTATDYLRKEFPNSNIEFIKGDSLKILPNIRKKYDLFHIDGDHENHIITKEFNFCKNLSANSNFQVIFDDVDSCMELKKNIFSTYKIINSFIPNCPWRNCYIQIQLEQEVLIDHKQQKEFKIKNFKSFLKELPFRFIYNIKSTLFFIINLILPKKIKFIIKKIINKN